MLIFINLKTSKDQRKRGRKKLIIHVVEVR